MHLVLFDCDGTLIDSQAIIVESMSAAFAANGLPPPARTAILEIVGLSLPIAIATLAGEKLHAAVADVTQSYKDAFQRLRAEPVDRMPLYPGAIEALDALAAEPDLVLGIATGKSRRGLDAVIAKHGLEGRFVTLQTADDAPSKPDPTMIRRALVETGAEASHTLLVGDTTFDMEMARAAGARGLGVAWGYHPAERLVAAGAARVVDGFAEVPGAVEALFGRRATVTAS